jgi:hypothetical protein
MNTPEEIQAMADRKRESAIKNLETMFKIPDGFSSVLVGEIVRDIMDAVMLEITSVQAETLKTK